MRKIIAFIGKLNSFFGFLSGLCVAAASILIISEIASRLVLEKSFQITDEFTGYLMAVSSFLGLGYVELKNGHIRMDLIDLLRSRFPRVLRALRIVTYVLAAVFALYLTYVGFKLFQQSYEYGSKSMQVSATPLAIPQIFVPIGAAALFLQYICNLCRYCMDGTSK
ncbi:MAG: TRAP transporter small permease [Synergistaceae bacterium]|jgi:TRAP-type C4-dicarboxylate transport system permease small subunit|nr:TRAP transporter small permease [Synergistaceae bacterium]